MDLSELKRDISIGLRDDVNKQLVPGENIVISLPGSFGEALVITDRRAIVAREQASGLDLKSDVYAHLLSHVKGASVTALSNGGYLELELKPAVANIETARVYFPSSEDARFKGAADYLNNLPAYEVPAAPSTVTPAESGACPQCHAQVGEKDTFCAACGTALKMICLSCGEGCDPGSVFCPKCGRQMVEFKPSCHKCGARTMRWMTYCPDCGSIQHPVCVGCGVSISPDWTYCASCGRQLGAGGLDCRTSAALRRRVDQFEQAEKTATVPGPEPREAASSSPAEEHNRRGTELFESENFDGAITKYQDAVRLDPENSAYHCNLGMAYDEAGRDSEALAEYQTTLKLDPNDLTALLSIGYMYSENDRPDEAREAWNRVLQIAPDSAEAQEVKQNLQHQGEL